MSSSGEINAPLVEPRLIDAGATAGAPGQCLVWRFPEPMIAISSSIVGGGLGLVSWILNMTVDDDYARYDPVDHLDEIARTLDLQGRGVGLMTAVDVTLRTTAEAHGAVTTSTVGVHRPVWAADPNRDDSPADSVPGTINLVTFVPRRLTEGALVNAVVTVTEAKAQVLSDYNVPGTGTASDAVCIVCPATGDSELFGGPRSLWGGRLAEAAYNAVAAGVRRQRS